MIKTYGLTHIALSVRDAERSLRFYEQLFGVAATYRDQGFIQAQTPGSRDVIVFQENAAAAGKPGGVEHFGFRLTDAADIDAAELEVERAGGTDIERGEFCPGEPYVFAKDPDGYQIEIWFELPTKVDAFADSRLSADS